MHETEGARQGRKALVSTREQSQALGKALPVLHVLAWVTQLNLPNLEMLLTDPLHKCLPGGGDAPSIPEPKERSLSSATAQGQGPFGGQAPLARAPAKAWPAPALFGLGPWGVSVLAGQSRCCHDGGHGTRERGPGNQGQTDPPSFTNPETPPLKQQLNIHSLRTQELWFEV